MHKANNYAVLIDRRCANYYRSQLSSISTFWTLTDWEWEHGYKLKEVRTFDDSLYLGVL